MEESKWMENCEENRSISKIMQIKRSFRTSGMGVFVCMKEDNMCCVDMVKTGKKIDELRKEKGVSVQMIADELCLCSRNAVYKWLRGDCLPEVGNLFSLAKMLEVSVEEIVVVYDV